MVRSSAGFLLAVALSGSALAQGDARFCGSYAANASGMGDAAVKKNPACLDYSRGVHGNYQSHFDWCMKNPRSSVHGAEANIRRLVSACTGNAARPATAAAPSGRPPQSNANAGASQRPAWLDAQMKAAPALGTPSPTPAQFLACNGLAGRFNRGASTITVSNGDRVHVTVGPKRPAGTGSCKGDKLTVNFPDDRTIAGTYGNRLLLWDNGTTWTKD